MNTYLTLTNIYSPQNSLRVISPKDKTILLLSVYFASRDLPLKRYRNFLFCFHDILENTPLTTVLLKFLVRFNSGPYGISTTEIITFRIQTGDGTGSTNRNRIFYLRSICRPPPISSLLTGYQADCKFGDAIHPKTLPDLLHSRTHKIIMFQIVFFQDDNVEKSLVKRKMRL